MATDWLVGHICREWHAQPVRNGKSVCYVECEKGFRESCLFMKLFVAVTNFYLSLILTTNTLYFKKISVFRN